MADTNSPTPDQAVEQECRTICSRLAQALSDHRQILSRTKPGLILQDILYGLEIWLEEVVPRENNVLRIVEPETLAYIHDAFIAASMELSEIENDLEEFPTRVDRSRVGVLDFRALVESVIDNHELLDSPSPVWQLSGKSGSLAVVGKLEVESSALHTGQSQVTSKTVQPSEADRAIPSATDIALSAHSLIESSSRRLSPESSSKDLRSSFRSNAIPLANGSQQASAEEQGFLGRPPRAPNPNAQPIEGDTGSFSGERSDRPLRLQSAEWDINSVSAQGALCMLQSALERLVRATDDNAPAPPIPPSLGPVNPDGSSLRGPKVATSGKAGGHSRKSIREIDQNARQHYTVVYTEPDIIRRLPFISKTTPPFSITEYLDRQHLWCPHSPGVYLAAACYLCRLCVTNLTIPMNGRTAHRLSIAAIRVAAKAIEDNKWPQERVARVGGLSQAQLMKLEISLCALLDFDLWVDDGLLARSMFQLQKHGRTADEGREASAATDTNDGRGWYHAETKQESISKRSHEHVPTPW